MQGQYQRRVLRDPEIVRTDCDALTFKLLDFADERPWVDDDAVADDRHLIGTDDARRKQGEFERFATEDKRMSGLVPFLEGTTTPALLRESINNFAFALSPLWAPTTTTFVFYTFS